MINIIIIRNLKNDLLEYTIIHYEKLKFVGGKERLECEMGLQSA